MDDKIAKSDKVLFQRNQNDIDNIFGCYHLPDTYLNVAAEKVQSVLDWNHFVSWNKITSFTRYLRSRKRKITILLLGPFPPCFTKYMFWCLQETLKRFLENFFPGMLVVFQDVISHEMITNCATRFHSKSHQKQLYINDIHQYLLSRRTNGSFCICGLSWFDLYPSEEENHILGEASFENSTVAVSFGHYAFYKEKEAEYQQRWKNDYVLERPIELMSDQSKEPFIFVTEKEKNEAELCSPSHETVCVTTNSRSSSSPKLGHSLPHHVERFLSEVTDSLSSLPTTKKQSNLVTDCDGDLVTNQFEVVDDNLINESINATNNALPPGSAFILDCKAFRRLFRVLSHEICHVMGMAHCQYHACTMNTSVSVLHADEQPLLLCPVCLRKLQLTLKFNLLARYKALVVFLQFQLKNFCTHDGACPFQRDMEILEKVINLMEG